MSSKDKRQNAIDYVEYQEQKGLACKGLGELANGTCRTGDRLRAAIKLCNDNSLYFDAINENLPEVLAMYDNVDSRKITADYYIDDKSLLPDYV